MARTAKLTVTLPRDLIALADRIAKEKKISRSKVVTACLQDLAEKERMSAMAEGYQVMAREQKQLAAMASKIEHEILPEWK